MCIVATIKTVITFRKNFRRTCGNSSQRPVTTDDVAAAAAFFQAVVFVVVVVVIHCVVSDVI